MGRIIRKGIELRKWHVSVSVAGVCVCDAMIGTPHAP